MTWYMWELKNTCAHKVRTEHLGQSHRLKLLSEYEIKDVHAVVANNGHLTRTTTRKITMLALLG